MLRSRCAPLLQHPLWKLPFLHPLILRRREVAEAVELIRQTTEELIANCRAMVDVEQQVCSCSRPRTYACLFLHVPLRVLLERPRVSLMFRSVERVKAH